MGKLDTVGQKIKGHVQQIKGNLKVATGDRVSGTIDKIKGKANIKIAEIKNKLKNNP